MVNKREIERNTTMANTTLFNELLDTLEKKIKDGVFKEGDKLPSERELSKTYDISRNIVRQVLTALREKGLISIKPGKGAYVTTFNMNKLTEMLQLVVEKHNGSIHDVFETREILEYIAVMKAVPRRCEENLIKLNQLCDKMDETINLNEFLKLDLEFHKTLAEATQNKVFSALVHSFYDLTNQFPFMITKYTNDFLQVTDQAQKEHRQLIRALEEKNETLAMKLIKEHMTSFKKEIDFYESKKMDQKGGENNG